MRLIENPIVTYFFDEGFASKAKPDHPDYSDEAFVQEMWKIINDSEADNPQAVSEIKRVISHIKSVFAWVEAFEEGFIIEAEAAWMRGLLQSVCDKRASRKLFEDTFA